MPLSLTLVWAVRPQDGERFSMSRFREIMDGLSVSLEGSLGSAVIGTGSITSDKLADTLITGLTDATPLASDTLMFHSAAAGQPRECTIQNVLDLGFGAFSAASTPALTDFAFGLVGGNNRKYTLADGLREAINGQTELTGAASIDKASDYVLVYDASAGAGTNKNRKTLVNALVQSVTNTLIADATAASSVASSDLLLISQSGTQKQATVAQLQAAIGSGVAKAWANITGNQSTTAFSGVAYTAPNTLTITGHGLSNDDVIWTTGTGNGLTQYVPYYVSVVDANNVKVATSKANRAAGTFVTITTSGAHNIVKWTSNPVINSFNVDGVCPAGTNAGSLVVDFTTDMANANFVPTVSGFYSGVTPGFFYLHPYGLAVGSVSIQPYDSGGLPLAVNKVFLSIFGT